MLDILTYVEMFLFLYKRFSYMKFIIVLKFIMSSRMLNQHDSS